MAEVISLIEVASIIPGDNDRTVFDPSGLQELADSIQTHGLAQPITVRPIPGGKYQIVAGERRFRAVSTVLKARDIACIVRDLTDDEASAIMLAENVSRLDLDPVDEAFAYLKRHELGWSVDDISKKAGVSKVKVEKRLRLCKVRADILFHVRNGSFPVGYAQQLACLDYNRQMIAARPVITGEPITYRQFGVIVDKLAYEQSQESLFDLALFGGKIETITLQVAGEEFAYPVAPDMPVVDRQQDNHVGNVIACYLTKLQNLEMNREAEVIGALLAGLVSMNRAKLPIKSSIKTGSS